MSGRGNTTLRELADLVVRAADDYRTRLMLAYCLALLFLIGIAQTPIDTLTPRIGWLNARPDDRIRLDVLEVKEATDAHLTATVITDPGLRKNAIAADAPGHESASAADDAGAGARQPAHKIRAREVLSFAEEQPELIGGLTSYYLNIEYPEEARLAGVQGRLVLSFVVEPTGQPSEIMVEQSLHPLCDSAAIAALANSRFIAGRHEGKKVPVRMRLPVRFRLIDMPEEPVVTESVPQ